MFNDKAGTLIPIHKDVNAQVESMSGNKTIIAIGLTNDRPSLPTGPIKAKTTNDLLRQVNPKLTVPLVDKDGMNVYSDFSIKKLTDFGAEELAKQSPLLTQLKRNKLSLVTLVQQLKTNRILIEYLGKPEKKAILVAQLQALLQELEEAE